MTRIKWHFLELVKNKIQIECELPLGKKRIKTIWSLCFRVTQSAIGVEGEGEEQIVN